MSGLEVAGVVLGAIPIIISALENYESNLDRARAFWKWQDELEKAIRELWIQHSSFEMTLRNLLKQVASPAEVQEMMQDFSHGLWASSALSEAFEEKLGAAFSVYIHTIREMESFMERLASHLNLERQTGTSSELEAIILANQPVETSSPLNTPRFEFKRRLKLTMKRKEIRSLLKDIRNCNERVDQFIAKADKFEQPAAQPAGCKSTLTLSLQEIQDYATGLHHALSRAWSCSSQAPHQVYLLLEHRMVRKKRQRSLRPAAYATDSTSFTVSLRSPSPTGHQYTIEVKIMDEVMDGIMPATRVRIQEPSIYPGNPTVITGCSKMKRVNHLCQFFCTHPDPPPSLGLRLDSRGRLYGSYEPLGKSTCPSDHLVTLEDLLSVAPSAKKRRPLTDEERYLLAITIASSLLQLHTTPWLGGYWCKEHILFSETPEGDTTVVDIHHPVVLQTYGCANAEHVGQVPSIGDHSFADLMQDSASLLTLAKVLLEVKLNARVGTHREGALGRDSGPNEATDIHTLMRWMTEEKGNLSFTYLDVISHCIKCSVDPSTNLRDPMFRQALVDKVVVPLLEELHYWQGGISR